MQQRVLPQPVETKQKTRRRFAPEPVEQSAKSNRKAKDAAPGTEDKHARRLLPQPIETSSKHSKTSATADAAGDDSSTPSSSTHLPQPTESSKAGSKAKKFAPQLMETTRRSRKRTDTLPAVLPSDKIEEYQPRELLHIPKHLRPSPTPPLNTPAASSERGPQLHESRFSAANLAKRETRRHSFRVPELPRIASSESEEESKVPSLSTSPSARSDESEPYKHATRIRESMDAQSSGYLLSLAAKTAEKQLRDQVLAAYPNEHDYERVSHFAVDRDSDPSDSEEGEGVLGARDHLQTQLNRRDSDAGWDEAEMRQHRDKLRQQRNDDQDSDRGQLDRRKSVKGPFADPAQTAMYAKAAGGGAKGADQEEWREMRKAASPPMAGGELDSLGVTLHAKPG